MRIEINGKFYRSKMDAYEELVSNHTNEELMELLEVQFNVLQQMKYNLKNHINMRQQPVIINGQEYVSNLDAYIDLAPKSTINELKEKLGITRQAISLYKISTGIDYVRKRIQLNGKTLYFSSNVEAYKFLAPNYTAKRLMQLLNVGKISLSNYRSQTNINYLGYGLANEFHYEGATYNSKTEAYVALAKNKTAKELMQILKVDRNMINVMKKKTNVHYKLAGYREFKYMGVTYRSKKAAYIALASSLTSHEVMDILKINPHSLSNYRSVTGIDPKSFVSTRLQEVRYETVVYPNRKTAYIALASKLTAKELTKVLSVNTGRISTYKRETGVSYLQAKHEVRYENVVYPNRKEAYIALASKLTAKELTKVLNVTLSSISNYKRQTGVSYRQAKSVLE